MSLFSGEFPPLRPFQVTTHEAIRQAAREGHKRILVMAPTAAGKTILALNVVKETLKMAGVSFEEDKTIYDVRIADNSRMPRELKFLTSSVWSERLRASRSYFQIIRAEIFFLF